MGRQSLCESLLSVLFSIITLCGLRFTILNKILFLPPEQDTYYLITISNTGKITTRPTLKKSNFPPGFLENNGIQLDQFAEGVQRSDTNPNTSYSNHIEEKDVKKRILFTTNSKGQLTAPYATPNMYFTDVPVPYHPSHNIVKGAHNSPKTTTDPLPSTVISVPFIFIPYPLISTQAEDIAEEPYPIQVEYIKSPSNPHLKHKIQYNTTTIFFCHGNSADLSIYLWAYKLSQYWKVNIVIYDYVGYGLSKKEKIISNSKNGDIRRVLQDKPKCTSQNLFLAAESALRYLLHNFCDRTEKVILYGQSIGTTICSHLATKYTHIGYLDNINDFGDTGVPRRERKNDNKHNNNDYDSDVINDVCIKITPRSHQQHDYIIDTNPDQLFQYTSLPNPSKLNHLIQPENFKKWILSYKKCQYDINSNIINSYNVNNTSILPQKINIELNYHNMVINYVYNLKTPQKRTNKDFFYDYHCDGINHDDDDRDYMNFRKPPSTNGTHDAFCDVCEDDLHSVITTDTIVTQINRKCYSYDDESINHHRLTIKTIVFSDDTFPTQPRVNSPLTHDYGHYSHESSQIPSTVVSPTLSSTSYNTSLNDILSVICHLPDTNSSQVISPFEQYVTKQEAQNSAQQFYSNPSPSRIKGVILHSGLQSVLSCVLSGIHMNREALSLQKNQRKSLNPLNSSDSAPNFEIFH